ncbi:MAG TPA: hypothetical protein EYH59_04250 [Pyrodictium sp.]|nr:hypothetical protein [Pyrodictium sp.]
MKPLMSISVLVKRLILLLLLTLAISTVVFHLVGAICQQHVTVHVLHARIEPVYRELPNGKVVEIYADIYYPDILLYYYTGNETYLGKVNVTLHCNWTGYWGANVKLIVIDPGFVVDPTTFKPTGYGKHWAEGGCLIGSGAAIVGINPHKGEVGKCVNILLWPRERFFEQAEKSPGAVMPVKLFIGIRVTLYDENGEIIEGGIINVYTNDKTAPNLTLLFAPAMLGTESTKPPNPMAYGVTAAIVVLLGYVLYVLLIRVKTSKSTT